MSQNVTILVSGALGSVECVACFYKVFRPRVDVGLERERRIRVPQPSRDQVRGNALARHPAAGRVPHRLIRRDLAHLGLNRPGF